MTGTTAVADPVEPAEPPVPRWHPETRWRAALAGVGLVALGVRVVYALAAAPNILEISDAGGYRLLGRHLSEGRGYIRPYDFALADVVRPTAEFPPGFPALLGVLDALGLESVQAQRLGLAVLGAAAVVGVVLLAGRWLPDRGAVAVGLVAAVHPALFSAEAALLAESLFLWAVIAVLLALVRFRESPTVGRAALLGLLGGAATLVRSEGLVLAVVLALPLLVTPPPRRIRVRAGAALVLGALVLPGAWAARNLSTFDEPVLVSNNVGSVLAGANCGPTYEGDLQGFWLISDECFSGFRDEDLRRVDESVVAGRLRDDGLRYARDHADDLPRVAVVRVLRTFQLWEPEQQARLATFEGRRLLTERITGWLTWGTLGLAAAGALHLARRRQLVDLWILGMPVVLVAVVAAGTYGNPRFRIAAEVPLLLLAALAVRVGAQALGRRRSDDSGGQRVGAGS
ncbi:MAG TPA: glycosyltransferase family 39 protein [Acidimicrobiales bacterium]|nr:glycosyltransferase family 39 protein [Acidimicrobiales bacterium]